MGMQRVYYSLLVSLLATGCVAHQAYRTEVSYASGGYTPMPMTSTSSYMMSHVPMYYDCCSYDFGFGSGFNLGSNSSLGFSFFYREGNYNPYPWHTIYYPNWLWSWSYVPSYFYDDTPTIIHNRTLVIHSDPIYHYHPHHYSDDWQRYRHHRNNTWQARPHHEQQDNRHDWQRGSSSEEQRNHWPKERQENNDWRRDRPNGSDRVIPVLPVVKSLRDESPTKDSPAKESPYQQWRREKLRDHQEPPAQESQESQEKISPAADKIPTSSPWRHSFQQRREGRENTPSHQESTPVVRENPVRLDPIPQRPWASSPAPQISPPKPARESATSSPWFQQRQRSEAIQRPLPATPSPSPQVQHEQRIREVPVSRPAQTEIRHRQEPPSQPHAMPPQRQEPVRSAEPAKTSPSPKSGRSQDKEDRERGHFGR